MSEERRFITEEEIRVDANMQWRVYEKTARIMGRAVAEGKGATDGLEEVDFEIRNPIRGDRGSLPRVRQAV